MSPLSFTPDFRIASTADIIEATPPFMLNAPPPYSRSPSQLGVHGSRFQPMASGSMSMCPFSIRLFPPPEPLSVAIV